VGTKVTALTGELVGVPTDIVPELRRIASTLEALDVHGDQLVVIRHQVDALTALANRLSTGQVAAATRRVMIVDDNSDAAHILAQLIGDLGYDVDVAPDASTALSLAATQRPAVALVDIGLPIMDGNQLAARLRSLGQIALIGMSGFGPNAASGDFAASFGKPIDFDRLASVLAELTTPRSL
jgi:CheY-like chemotaxis protein